MSQEVRSEALIEVLQELGQSEIEFVLVGGYAVSQFQARFSTDLDLVISPGDFDEIVAFLDDRAFERTEDFVVLRGDDLWRDALNDRSDRRR